MIKVRNDFIDLINAVNNDIAVWRGTVKEMARLTMLNEFSFTFEKVGPGYSKPFGIWSNKDEVVDTGYYEFLTWHHPTKFYTINMDVACADLLRAELRKLKISNLN